MEKKYKLGVFELTSVIVGSSIGTGIFGLNSDLARAAAPGPALIAWLIVGAGMFCLVMSLNNLAQEKPGVGIFGYAGEYFGPMGEFVSGWIYWISGLLGNAAYAMMMMNALGFSFPESYENENLIQMIGAVAVLWLLSFLVICGVKSASFVNAVVTCAKLLSLLLFTAVMCMCFKAGIMTADFWGRVSDKVISGTYQPVSVFRQISSSLAVMVWAFFGIEGAEVLSRRARRPSDARKASVWGMITLTVVYILVSLLPYGVMTRHELATCPQPAMACIMQQTMGPVGVCIINGGIIISTVGAWLAWTLLSGETLLTLSRDGVLPEVFGRKNRYGAPRNAVLFGAFMQTVLLVILHLMKNSYNQAYLMATSAVFVVYLFVGIDQVRFSLRQGDRGGILIGLGVALLQLWAMFMMGYWQALGMFILYLPGLVLHARARRERGFRLSNKEMVVVVMSVLIGVEIISMLFF